MKKITTLLILISISRAIGQVGIGTENPQADLHVAGDVVVQDGFALNNLAVVSATEEDFKLVTRVTNPGPFDPVGEITVLDVAAKAVAPVNIVDYSFTNIHLDNLTDVDLQYDASKYIVGVANFRHTGDAVKKIATATTFSIGHFVIRAFVSGGTWHLEIRNVDLDLDVGDSLDYHIQLIIYDKSYFRQLPSIITDLGGSNKGSASSIPILF